MPKTMSNTSGDGVSVPLVVTQITVPDSGSTISISGAVKSVGGSYVDVTGSPLTAPTPPASGSIYWIIEVNTTTGAASVKQSTSAMPTADAGTVTVFSDIMSPTDTVLSADSQTATPDEW